MSNEGIELRIFDYNDPTKYLDTIYNRQSPKFLEELGGSQGGSFTVSTSDAQVAENPRLIDYRQVVKVAVDNKEIGIWLIRGNDSETITEGELTSEVYNVNGPSALEGWLDDATVRPYGSFTRYSADKRYFNFATERGDWYDPSQWLPALWAGDWGYDPWGNLPDKWPSDHAAKWIWATAYESPFQAAPGSVSIFRHEFTTNDDGGTWVFYLGGDDFMEAWVDGVKIVDTDFLKISFAEPTKVELQLPKGDHVLTARITNGMNATGNPGGLMAAIYHKVNDVEQLYRWTGRGPADGGTWWSYYIAPGSNRMLPTWTPGAIMLKLIDEAKARGVRSMSWMKPTFTSTRDSDGVLWPVTDQPWEFEVGESLYSVASKIMELGYYMELTPNLDLTIRQQKGSNRAIDPGAMVFERGKNLRKASQKGVGKIKNALAVKTDEGWLIDPATTDTTSVAKYGRLESTFSAKVTASTAKSLLKPLFKQYATAEEGATYEVVTTEDMVPWIDYLVGDYVLAPDRYDLLIPRRVVSISVEQGDNGRPLYTIEFDTIFQDNEQKMAKIISNVTGGGVGNDRANGTGVSPAIGTPITPPAPVAMPVPPKLPTGLAITSEGTWNQLGSAPLSIAHVSWDRVLTNTANTAITVEYYEVQMRTLGEADEQVVASTTALTANVQPLAPGVEYQFRVRAVQTVDGPVSAFSPWVTHKAIGPSTPLPAPSTPTLSSSMGLLTVNWDGLLGNAEPARQFRYVYAQVSTDGVNWQTNGSVMQRNGRSTNIAGLTVGTNYRVRLIAMDVAGIASEPSGIANITLTGIDLGSLEADLAGNKAAIEAAEDAIDQLGLDLDEIDIDVTQAQSTANNAQTVAEAARLAAASKSKVWPTGPTPPTSGMAVDDLFIRSTDGALMRFSSLGWLVVPLATQAYIQSRSFNLITNGTGLLGNNTNFSPFTFDPSDHPTGALGMFSTNLTLALLDELIPVDPTLIYELSYAVKQLVAGGADPRYYSMVAPYDADGLAILPYHYTERAGTRTTLATELKSGDTVVNLTSSNSWMADAAAIQASNRFLAIWNWTDGKGYTWGPGVYSRRVYPYASITGNEITLNTPYTGPTIPAGTIVGNSLSGGNYLYPNSNKPINTADGWLLDSGRISGVHTNTTTVATTSLPRPTSAVRVGFLPNRGTIPAGSRQGFANVSFNEVTVGAKAQATADGKNSIFTFNAPTLPTRSTPGRAAGDIAWVRNSVTGVIVAQYEWNGTDWFARTLDDTTIANLNAGKLTAGFVNTDRLQASSIGTQKLRISDFENLFDGSNFESMNLIPWVGLAASARSSLDNIVVNEGTASLRVGPSATVNTFLFESLLTVVPGEEYLITMYVRTDAAYNGLDGNAKLRFGDKNNVGLQQVAYGANPRFVDTWVPLTYTYVPPAGITALQMSLNFNHTAGNIWLDGLSMRHKNGGELIVDGSITTRKIGAAQVIAEHLQARLIDASKIQVGTLIAELFMAGTITAREIAVGGVEADNVKAGAIQVSHLSPSVGKDLDISANGTVTIIAGQVNAATAAAGNAQDGVAEMRTYYEFGPDGATVSTPDSPFAVAIRNDRIEMLEQGNVVSYWNAGSLFVDQLVGEKVILGYHQLEKYGTGTVVRAL